MKKQHYFLILVLLFLAACRCDPLRDKLTVVEAGKTRNAVMDFQQWETVDGMLEGQKLNNMLYAAARIDSGQWEIRTKFLLQAMNEQAPTAFLEFGGNRLHLEFDENAESLLLAGPDFNDSLKLEKAEVRDYFRSDTLNLEVRGNDDWVAVWMNGDSLSALPLNEKITGKIGFYALRGMLRIRDFRVVAHLSKIPEGDPPGRAFRRGEAGINVFRKPAICSAGDSLLLVFCEGRPGPGTDFGDIDIRMRKSTDGGKSWKAQTVLAKGNKGSGSAFHSPSVIYEAETGLVHLLIGKDYRELWYLQSSDQGNTWSTPAMLRDTSGGPLFNGSARAVSGKAAKVSSGEFAGRLIFPVILGPKEERHSQNPDSLFASVIYSEDSGKTWQAGGRIEGLSGPTTHSIVALPDGNLMSSVRLFPANNASRAVSMSNDGGSTWSELRYEKELKGGVPGSLLAAGEILYFSSPNSGMEGNRSRLTLRMSDNQGKKWGPEMVLWESNADHSDLVLLEGGKRLGCLFEFGYHYKHEAIVLRSYDLDSLQKVGLNGP